MENTHVVREMQLDFPLDPLLFGDAPIAGPSKLRNVTSTQENNNSSGNESSSSESGSDSDEDDSDDEEDSSEDDGSEASEQPASVKGKGKAKATPVLPGYDMQGLVEDDEVCQTVVVSFRQLLNPCPQDEELT